jgi:hypothetical protein
MSSTIRLTRVFWRWYAALLLANALDLLFTYIAAERGIDELNPVMRPLLLTPWPAVVKLAAFSLLGFGLWQVVRNGRRPELILVLLQGVTILYLLVIGVHLLGLTLMVV